MAKLQAPCFSLGASGALGKDIVYGSWKGIDTVRSYAIPANPRTASQQTQRAFMTAAVAEWHAALYTALDAVAFNRWAGVAAKIMSGFNRLCREHINEGISGNTWERLHDGQSYGAQPAQFSVEVTKAGGGNAPTCHYGTSKTFMPNTQVLADQGGDVWAAFVAGLSSDTLYYFYFDVGTTGVDYARTGIYQQKTS